MFPLLSLFFAPPLALAAPDATDVEVWRSLQAELDAAYDDASAPVVRVEEGTIWVSGRIADEKERVRVHGLIAAVAPEATLQDDLEIGPPTPVEDRRAEDLVARRIEALGVDGEVEVEDGVARVDATVRRPAEARRVHAIVEQTPDVDAAVTRVGVQNEAASDQDRLVQDLREAVFWSGAECLGLTVDVTEEVATIACEVATKRDVRRIRREVARRGLSEVRLDLEVQ